MGHRACMVYFLHSFWVLWFVLLNSLSDNYSIPYPGARLNNVTVPLKKAGNLLLIDGTVDGVSGSFILDTGAPGLVLNSTYFREGRPTFNAGGGGITGEGIERRKKRIKSCEFSGLVFEQITADVINLGHIENSKKVKILGLIGTYFIRDFEVIIDVKRMNMRLYRVDRKGGYVEPCPEKTEYSVHHKTMLFKDIIVTYLPVGGKKVFFCLDTGAEQNVLHNRNHRKVLGSVSITGRSHLIGASQQRIEVLHGVMNDFAIGNHQMDGMGVVVLDLTTMRNGFGVNIDGMLGYDFFQLGIIRLNLQKKLMSIAFYDQN